MLAIQRYLLGGKAPEDLRSEFGITSYRHPTLPLTGFKYRADSPKTHPVVRDARGVVLEDETWDVVARPFRRFFNYGEVETEFDWSDFESHEKVDGSLLIVYRYKGQVLVNTSGSFGLGCVGGSGKTWRELFWEHSGLPQDRVFDGETILFELWTPHNKIVRVYPEPTVFILAAIFNDDGDEYCTKSLRCVTEGTRVRHVDVHEFGSIDEVTAFLKQKERDDPTYEGFVLRDVNGNRIKVKSASYLAFHRFYDNGGCVHPKRLVPLWLGGDYREVLAHFPDVEPHLLDVGGQVDAAFDELAGVWRESRDIEGQKEFAQYILPRTPFSGILFDVRKRFYGREQTLDGLRDAWKQWPELICKKLFEERQCLTNR